MNLQMFKTRLVLSTLGACFALLLVASPASAVPDGFQPQLQSDSSDAVSRYVANHRAHEEQAYRATGVGSPEPTVIPYLSHGIGIENEEWAGRVRAPDVLQPSDPVAAVDSGFEWETTGLVAGGILAALLLSLMSTIALRTRRGPQSA